jgi:hypothetical protein
VKEASSMAKIPKDPKHFLKIAEEHLRRVIDARAEPDWSDLGTYGLYCLEAMVRSAVLKTGGNPSRKHWEKAKEAKNLHKKHGLPDISDLLGDLNHMRKAKAYGDEEFDESDYDAEEIARRIEEYYEKVSALVKK